MNPHKRLARIFSFTLVCVFIAGNLSVPDDRGQHIASVFYRKSGARLANLAPASSVDLPGFREKFRAQEVLLSHKAVNHYIKDTLEKEFCVRQAVTQKVVFAAGENILAISVPGLLRKTGLFAHVGLGRTYKMPVIYVDGNFFNDEDVLKHETDEIIQWERFRQEELRLESKAMRAWIMKNPEAARQKAKEFHEKANKLKGIYELHVNKRDFDYEYITTLIDLYGEGADESDVTIAAIPTVAEGRWKDKDDLSVKRDGIFEALVDLFKHGSDPAKRAGVEGYLKKCDSALVAESVIEFMMHMQYTYYVQLDRLSGFDSSRSGRSERVDTPDPDLFESRYPPKYERDLSRLFSNWLPINDIADLEQFRKHVTECQNAFFRLAVKLGPDVTKKFITGFESEYYKRDIPNKVLFEHGMMIFPDEAFELDDTGKASFLKAIEELKMEPMVGYGIFSYAYMNMALEKDPRYIRYLEMAKTDANSLMAELAQEKDDNIALMLQAIIRQLQRESYKMQDVSSPVIQRVPLVRLGFDDSFAQKLFRKIIHILRYSKNMRLLRHAYALCAFVKDIPENMTLNDEPTNVRYLLCTLALSCVGENTDDTRLRCWMSRNIANFSFFEHAVAEEYDFLTLLSKVLKEEADTRNEGKLTSRLTAMLRRPLSLQEENILKYIIMDSSKLKRESPPEDTRLAIFKTLAVFAKDGLEPAKYEAAKAELAKRDPKVVAGSVVNLMMHMQYTCAVHMERLGITHRFYLSEPPEADLFKIIFPAEYNSELSQLFSGWPAATDKDSMLEFLHYTSKRQKALFKLAVDLGPDVTKGFILALESEYYKRDVPHKLLLDDETMFFVDGVFELDGTDKEKFLKAIDELKDDPMVGYGIFSYAFLKMAMKDDPAYAKYRKITYDNLTEDEVVALMDELAQEKDEHKILRIFHALLCRLQSESKIGRKERSFSIKRVPLEWLSFNTDTYKLLYSKIISVLRDSRDPFLIRHANALCVFIENLSEKTRNVAFSTATMRLCAKTDDIKKRCWLSRNLAAFSFAGFSSEFDFLATLARILNEEVDIYDYDAISRRMAESTGRPLSPQETTIIKLIVADPSLFKGSPASSAQPITEDQRLPVIKALVDFVKHGPNPAKCEAVKAELAKRDPKLVAESVINLMMRMRYECSVQSERLGIAERFYPKDVPSAGIFKADLPKEFEDELSQLFSEWWSPVIDEDSVEDSMSEFWSCANANQKRLFKLVVDLGPEATKSFILALENEYYKRDVPHKLLFDEETMFFQDGTFDLDAADKEKVLKAIDELKDNPMVGYGIFSYAFLGMSMKDDPVYARYHRITYEDLSEDEITALMDELSEEKDDKKIFCLFQALLYRLQRESNSERDESSMLLERVPLNILAFTNNTYSALYGKCWSIIRTSHNPFLLRHTYALFAFINDMRDDRNQAFRRMLRHVSECTDDIKMRSWLSRNMATFSFTGFSIGSEFDFLTTLSKVLNEEANIYNESEILRRTASLIGRPLSDHETKIIQWVLVDPSRLKGSPASLLDTIKKDRDLLEKLLSPEGVSVGELAVPREPFAERTVSKEIEMLKKLGIFVPANTKGQYRFSDMIAKEDISRIGHIIDAIKDIRMKIGKTEKPLDRYEIPGSEILAVGRLVENAYDTENARYLLGEVFNAPIDGRIYEIRYDISRLSASQVKVIEEYARALQVRAQRPDNIKARPFRGGAEAKEPLITVRCTGTNFKGEGSVDVLVQKGELKDYRLRITGMINIALAASNIPDNLTKEQIAVYGDVVRVIKNQYRAIVGKELAVSDESPEDFLKAIRRIVLDLPASDRISIEGIEEYNRAMQQTLAAA